MEKKITQTSSINHFTLFYFEKATIFQIAIKAGFNPRKNTYKYN